MRGSFAHEDGPVCEKARNLTSSISIPVPACRSSQDAGGRFRGCHRVGRVVAQFEIDMGDHAMPPCCPCREPATARATRTSSRTASSPSPLARPSARRPPSARLGGAPAGSRARAPVQTASPPSSAPRSPARVRWPGGNRPRPTSADGAIATTDYPRSSFAGANSPHTSKLST